MRIKIFIANEIRDVKRGGGGGLALSVTMTLIFPKIVRTCSLTDAETSLSSIRLLFMEIEASRNFTIP